MAAAKETDTKQRLFKACEDGDHETVKALLTSELLDARWNRDVDGNAYEDGATLMDVAKKYGKEFVLAESHECAKETDLTDTCVVEPRSRWKKLLPEWISKRLTRKKTSKKISSKQDVKGYPDRQSEAMTSDSADQRRRQFAVARLSESEELDELMNTMRLHAEEMERDLELQLMKLDSLRFQKKATKLGERTSIWRKLGQRFSRLSSNEMLIHENRPQTKETGDEKSGDIHMDYADTWKRTFLHIPEESSDKSDFSETLSIKGPGPDFLRANLIVFGEEGRKIRLPNVVLDVPPVTDPVNVTVTHMESYGFWQQQVQSAGLQEILEPEIQLCLEPHGLEFSSKVIVKLKNVKLSSNEQLLIFHKDVHPGKETFWTDVTMQCAPRINKDRLSVIFEIDRFSIYHIWKYVGLAAVPASLYIYGLLNSKQAQCKFHTYFKPCEPLSPLVTLVQTSDAVSPNPEVEPGYVKGGYNVSRCNLLDGELLHFYYETGSHWVAKFNLKMADCEKSGQKILLPVDQEDIKYPPDSVIIRRLETDQVLCKVTMKSSGRSQLGSVPRMVVKTLQASPSNDVNVTVARQNSTQQNTDGIDFVIRDVPVSRQQWRDCLRNNRDELVNSLQVDNLLSGCLKLRIFSDRQVAAIKANSTIYEKAGAFCDHLLRVDSQYYIPFLRLLHDHGCQPSLARELAEQLGIL